jgi:cellulose synthase/poly-beta-1,6-N-acetylglucosamine synthase-like glycosyltransferase
MIVLQILFWSSAALLAYTYLLYPLALGLLARWCGRPVRRGTARDQLISILLAVHNEEAAIDRRLRELIDHLARAGLPGEIVVVSNGSTDSTVALARAYMKGPVRVLDIPATVGKAAALTAAAAAAQGALLVFCDARQWWANDALERLLENFADPAVGAVSGNLIIEKAPGVLAGVGLYWRFEKWLRSQESLLFAMVGATGAISAVRRELFRPIPAGTILDDVYWPLQVALQGYRVVLDPRARAYDRLPERTRDEFRRKVRTLSGNFQLVARLPAVVRPWRNPIWVQFVSHKLLRLVSPWALLALLAASALLPETLYQTAFWAQLAGYAVAACGLWTSLGTKWKPVAAAASFLVLNTAAWMAFWVWLTGRAGPSWGKATYPADQSQAGQVGPVSACPYLETFPLEPSKR